MISVDSNYEKKPKIIFRDDNGREFVFDLAYTINSCTAIADKGIKTSDVESAVKSEIEKERETINKMGGQEREKALTLIKTKEYKKQITGRVRALMLIQKQREIGKEIFDKIMAEHKTMNEKILEKMKKIGA